jgi:hypothetical protein
VLVLGGATSSKQVKGGSAPNEVNHVRAFNLNNKEWEILSPLPEPIRNSLGWIDYERHTITVMKLNGDSSKVAQGHIMLGKEPSRINRTAVLFRDDSWRITVQGFTMCVRQHGGEIFSFTPLSMEKAMSRSVPAGTRERRPINIQM